MPGLRHLALVIALLPAMPVMAQDDIGYASALDALAALRAMPGASTLSLSGANNTFFLITEPGGAVTWRFTTETDPAHPAAIRMSTVTREGQRFRLLRFRCDGAEAACAQLIQNFTAEDARLNPRAQRLKE